ncbi:MAG TPA: glycine oxidase ThiO [Bacillales bacterium]
MREKVIVIGGGVIGLASAFECANRGYEVVVLEKGTCGGQASGAAAGMLAPFSEISEDPDDFFRLCYESLKLYAEWQREVKQRSEMEFEYKQSGSLHAVFHDAERLGLETTINWQNELGVEAHLLDQNDLSKMEPEMTCNISEAVYYPEESHLYSPNYVKALEAACRKTGVVIHEYADVTDVIPRKDGVTIKAGKRLYLDGDALVICAGAWAGQWEKTFGVSIPIVPIRGQICAYHLPQDTVRKIVFTSQGYFVQKANGSLVCGASEDIAGFDTSVTEEGISRLERWSKVVFPFLEKERLDHRWAGLRPSTQDGFPLLGRLRDAPNVIFATGHYRNGILLSPITAKTVGDLLDREKPIVPLKMFKPDRFGYK